MWNEFNTIPSRAPMLRPAPHCSKLIDIYIFCLCVLFCFTKAVLHKAATFGNYSVHVSIRKMIPQSAFYHTDRRSQTILSLFLFLPVSHSLSPFFFIFIPLPSASEERNAGWAMQIFKIFRVIYRLSFLLNLTWVRKRESMYANLFFLAL